MVSDSGRSQRDSFCDQDWNQRPVLLPLVFSFPQLSLQEGCVKGRLTALLLLAVVCACVVLWL